MRILIIDDSLDHQNLIRRMLNIVGYTDILTADSAAAAFRHLGLEGLGQVPRTRIKGAQRGLTASRTGTDQEQPSLASSPPTSEGAARDDSDLLILQADTQRSELLAAAGGLSPRTFRSRVQPQPLHRV